MDIVNLKFFVKYMMIVSFFILVSLFHYYFVIVRRLCCINSFSVQCLLC